MKYPFPLFLITGLLAGGLTNRGYAQSAGTSVSGKAVDADNQQPLIGATILLIHLPDSLRRGTTADPDGAFRFEGVTPGPYVVSTSFLGFQTRRQTVTVADQPLDLGTLTIRAASVRLGTAEVVGRTPPVVTKSDTAQYNANAFKTNPDANAQDLVTKMPGITVGADGKVQAQGENVQRVLVDGKQFFGDDPTSVLQNVPAEMIDKIQVFDRQSEQSQFSGFDDGNTMKTLNIVTKPQFRSGQFGRVVAGAGPERYKASVSLNSFEGDKRLSVVAQSNNVNEQNFGTEDLLGVMSSSSGGQGGGGQRSGGRAGGGGRGGFGGPGGGGSAGNFLVNPKGGISTTHAAGLNYSDKWGLKTEVQASYFYNYNDNLTASALNRQYVLPGAAGRRYTETSDQTSQNQNHRASLRLEHKFDSANSLLWQPRLSVQLNEGRSQLLGQTLRSDTLTSTVRSGYTSRLTGLNFGGELLFRHRFATRGRTLSLSATPTYSYKEGTNTLRAGTALGERDTLNQYSSLLQRGWGLSTNLAFTEPLGARSQLQANYAFSYAPNDSRKKTYDFNDAANAYSALDTTLSSVFQNQYVTHGAGLSLNYQPTKELRAVVGATGQVARLTGDQTFPRATEVGRTFWNVLPNAQLRWAISRDKNLRLNYQARTNVPSISQLQEVVNNANPLQLTTGNPDLKQEYQHNAFLRYSAAQPEKSTTFFAVLSGSFTQQNITNATTVALDTLRVSPTLTLLPGTQLTRPTNLNGQFALRSFAVYGLPLKALRSNLNFNAALTYNRTPGLVNGALNYARSPSVNGGVTISSNISQNLDFTLSSNTSFTTVSNTLRTTADNQYVTQTSGARLSWIFGPGISFQTDVSHQLYSGLSAGFNQNYVLWNASLGKKILPGRRGELKLYVFDILKQNQSIQRTITEAYQEDQRTNILQRYVMVQFTYNLRRGTGLPERGASDGDRPPGVPPPGMRPPMER